MKVILRFALPLVLYVSLMACSKTAIPVSTSGSKPTPTATTVASEDFSIFRPKFGAPEKRPVIVERKQEMPKYTTADQPLHVNRRLDMVLDTIALRNRSVKHTYGYRVQVYVGVNRQEADAAKTYTYTSFPDIIPYMSFTSPTYRVKVGDFINRIDAERYYSLLKSQFAGAVILNEKVEIKKSILIK
jgi:SPOR domain